MKGSRQGGMETRRVRRVVLSVDMGVSHLQSRAGAATTKAAAAAPEYAPFSVESTAALSSTVRQPTPPDLTP